jgi:hypothetical protein
MTHPSNPEGNLGKSVWQLCSDTWFFPSKLFHSVKTEKATKTKINNILVFQVVVTFILFFKMFFINILK